MFTSTSCPFQLSLNELDVTFWGFHLWLCVAQRHWNELQFTWEALRIIISNIIFHNDIFKVSRTRKAHKTLLKRPKTGRKRSVNARQSVEIVETFCKAPAKKKRSDYSANIVFFRVRKIFRFVFCVTQHSDKLRRGLKVNLMKHFEAWAGLFLNEKFGTFLLEYLWRTVVG